MNYYVIFETTFLQLFTVFVIQGQSTKKFNKIQINDSKI